MMLQKFITLEAQKGFQQGKTLVKSYKSVTFIQDFHQAKNNNNEIIHSHKVLLEILDLHLENTNETLQEYENSCETL